MGTCEMVDVGCCDLLLPEMYPIIKDGVGVAARREHVDCLENAHQDRAVGRCQWLADSDLAN
jgi:hypothetical protein